MVNNEKVDGRRSTIDLNQIAVKRKNDDDCCKKMQCLM